MANEKILVVDDELPIRLALKTAFLREGMQVQEASCGKEASCSRGYDSRADAQRKAGGDGPDPGAGNGSG